MTLARRLLSRLIRKASFSIYGEDSLLFAGLQPARQGFYVDVGAHSPVEGSNTFRLYRRGWRGLTIEPNPEAAQAFRRRRPGDIHIVEGVSRSAGRLEYFKFDHTVMNTFSPERAAHIQRHGQVLLGSQMVITRPLRAIVADHAAGRHVDCLNVDCEGLDLEVLESADLASMRPTVIVVEDLDGYYGFRDAAPASPLQTYLRQSGYQPIAQAFYSTVYIASAWESLLASSPAFAPPQRALLPEHLAFRG